MGGTLEAGAGDTQAHGAPATRKESSHGGSEAKSRSRDSARE